MPPEATNPVKTIGVAENEEDTDPQGTYKENQPSSKIGGDGEQLENEGERGTPDEDIYHPNSLTPSTQAVNAMYLLGKNPKQDYSCRFSEIMHHAMAHVSLKRGLEESKDKGQKAVDKELLQLHMKIKFRPLTSGYLSDK